MYTLYTVDSLPACTHFTAAQISSCPAVKTSKDKLIPLRERGDNIQSIRLSVDWLSLSM